MPRVESLWPPRPGNSGRRPSFGNRPPVERSAPPRAAHRPARAHRRSAGARTRRSRRQPVVRMLGDHLRAPAAQDLDRARAPDRRRALQHDIEDRVVQRRPAAPVRERELDALGSAQAARTHAPTPAAGPSAGAAGSHPGIADVAARHRGCRTATGPRSAPATPRDGTASARRSPRSPGTAPARPLGVARRAAARRERAAVPGRQRACPASAVGRRGSRRDHAGAREMADDRARSSSRVALRTRSGPASSASARS